MDWYCAGFDGHSIYEFKYLSCKYRHAWAGCLITDRGGPSCRRKSITGKFFLTASIVLHWFGQSIHAVAEQSKYLSNHVVISHCGRECGLYKCFKRKGKSVAYVRLNMVEFKSTKDMRKDMGEMHKSMTSVYPIYVCLLGWKHLKHRMLELLFMMIKRLPIEP